MSFAGLNLLAIALAGVAGYAFGAAWYMALSKPWMAAAKLTEDEVRGRNGDWASVRPFLIAFLAQFVIAWTLAGLIGHLGPGQVTLWNGLISAGFVWLGFVAAPMLVNHQFQGASGTLTAIDSGHWLGVLLIQGAIIGTMGV